MGAGQYSQIWGNDYRQTANDNIMVIIMIETPIGVENAAKIADVPGVDVIFAASTDLGNFSGYKQGDPQYEALVTRIHDVTLRAGLKLGGPLAWKTRAGFTFFQVTPDGLEMTFAVNHMAYFVVTLGLAERLQGTPGARVVNTSSDAHKGRRLDFDDLQSAKRYRGFPVYGKSKLCNILFTRELARRWRGAGVTANCLHPGFVATRFGDGSGGFFERVGGGAKHFAITPPKGADTHVDLA